MAHIDWGGAAAVAGMYLVFLFIGWIAARKVKHGAPEELIIAGRSMSLWVATLTMTATWVDGGYLLGTAEYVYKHGLARGTQAGLCFGLSLIVGGLFFAKRMRQLEYSTMIDPFESRFGPGWAAVLSLPAMLGELFWSGALLVAIGSTFAVLLRMDLNSAIVLSAVVVTLYTMIGGMWSVAYTDAFQLALIPVGLLAALPFALERVGGLEACLQTYVRDRPNAGSLIPPWHSEPGWAVADIASWWDGTAMLILGGIPWNCYFQRVLSCQTPTKARWHSFLAGALTISLMIPPVLLGMAAFAYFGADGLQTASETLPLLLLKMTPYGVMLLGLAAIIGAVTSSFSSSILSAGSMWSWNVYRRLLNPNVSVNRLKLVLRSTIVTLGALAVLLALRVKSVAALWIFTGDLVFVLLFPQLVMALFDRKANRIGSIAAFTVSLLLRLAGGVSLETDDGLIGFPAVIPYPELCSSFLGGDPGSWYDAVGATSFPVKSLAAFAGLILLPVVSRMTASLNPPQPLTANKLERENKKA